MPPKAVVQQDFSKGTNIVTNPYDISGQQSVLLLNLLLDEHGSVRARPGTKIITAAPEAARRIVRVFDFVKNDGSILNIAILRGNATRPSTLYLRTNSVSVPWTKVGDFDTIEDIPDVLTMADRLLIVHGYETPWEYSGGAMTHLTSTSGPVPPGGKHHSFHLSFYWLWNTAAATTASDGPSSLRSSDLNNPDSWPLANQIFISKDDGQKGQGLAQYTIAESGISPTDTQIAFKDFSAYQISAVFGADQFAIQRVKSDMGCVAPRTIQFVAGFGIFRLTHRGVAHFDGVDDHLISEEVRPLFFGGNGYTEIDWTNVNVSYAAQVQNPPLYLLFCPTAGAALTRCFCYDLVRQSWSILQFPVPFSSVQLIYDPNTLPVVLAGDYSDRPDVVAKIRRLFGPDLDDDCTSPGIQWQLFAKPPGGNSPQTRGYFRRAILKVFNVVKDQPIRADFIFGPVAQSVTPVELSRTLVVPVDDQPTVGIGPGFGLDPFGLGPFGSTVNFNSEVDLNCDLGVIATNGRGIFSGTGPITIRGLEWHIIAKPLVRPSIYA